MSIGEKMPAAGGSSLLELATEREEHSTHSACQKSEQLPEDTPLKAFGQHMAGVARRERS